MSRARGMQGFTLVEVLLGMAVSSIIILPLFAWMTTGVKVGTTIENTSTQTLDRNLLTTYLRRDVLAARTASKAGVDCTGGTGAGGTVLLSTSTTGADPLLTIYSATVDSKGLGVIWRRVCHNGGVLTSEIELLGRIVVPPTGWPSRVDCRARVGVVEADADCGRVTMSFTTPTGQPVYAIATRRIVGAR